MWRGVRAAPKPAEHAPEAGRGSGVMRPRMRHPHGGDAEPAQGHGETLRGGAATVAGATEMR